MTDKQRDVLKMKCEVEDILCDLDKAATVLNHWASEYLFYDRPDPMAAIKFGNGIKTSDNIHELQSAKWFTEYPQITQFVNIATDYILRSKQRLTALVD